MNMYFTTGTLEFLKTIKEKFSYETLVLMQNNENALLLHETIGSTIFNNSKSYEIIETIGTIAHEGFVAINYIPVTDEGIPLFEHHIKKQLISIESISGMRTLHFLRPKDSNTYIILTIWDLEQSFKSWQISKQYSTLTADDSSGINTMSNVFSMPAYVSSYHIYLKE